MSCSPRPGPWPLLTRADVRDRPVAGLVSTPARAQLIQGPPGVGKSVLAESVVQQMPRRAPLRVIGIAELAGVPLGAFAAVRATLGLPVAPDEAVPALVARLSAEAERHVLLVDDAPRLDPISAGVVHTLIRTVHLPTVLTARWGESLPDALRGLVDEGRCDVHDLAGLSTAETGDLLTRRFGRRVRHADVHRLRERTEGNPLYLRSLVERALESGGVDMSGPVVRVRPGSTPAGLLATVGERVAALDASQRRLLHVLALCQPVAPQVLDPREEHAADLDALEVGGFTAPGDGMLRLAHPLYGEVLAREDDIDEVRRTAAALLRASGLPADRFTACRLLLPTPTPPDPDELGWAASYALAAGDPRGAVTLAVQALEGQAREGQSSFPALITAGTASGLSGELDAADAYFADAARWASSDEDKLLLAARWGEHLAFRRGDAAAAISRAEQVTAGLADSARNQLEPDLRLWRIQLGELDAADADPAGALSGAEDAVDPALALRNAAMTVLFASLSGQIDLGGEAEQAMVADLDEVGLQDPTAAAMLGFNTYVGLVSDGEGERARHFLAERRAAGTGDIGLWSFIGAEHALFRGAMGEARELVDIALDQLRWRDELGATLVATELKALIAAQSGEIDDARRLREQQGTYPSMLPTTGQLIAETRAWIALAGGDRDRAIDLVFAAAEEARELGFRFIAALGLTFAIRIGEAERAAKVLGELAAEVPGDHDFYAALHDLARSLSERRPGGVAQAARRVARCDLTPTALDAITQALRMRPSGEQRRRLEQTYAALARDVDVPLLQAPAAEVLSDRELEVARRAARRERSREIAEALDRSVSTVNNQLQSVYRKLGVSGRDELREVLVELGLDT